MKKFLLFVFAIAVFSSCERDPIIEIMPVPAETAEARTLDEIGIDVLDGVVTFNSGEDFGALIQLIESEGIEEVKQFFVSEDFVSAADRYEELLSKIETIESEEQLELFLEQNRDYLTVETAEGEKTIHSAGIGFLDFLVNENFEFAIGKEVVDTRAAKMDPAKIALAACGNPVAPVYAYYNPIGCSNDLRTSLTAGSLNFNAGSVTYVQLRSYKKTSACAWILGTRYNELDDSVVEVFGNAGLSASSFPATYNIDGDVCNGCHTLTGLKWSVGFYINDIESVDASGESLMPFGGQSQIELNCQD